MGLLRDFLDAPPPEIVRIKGFVIANEKQYLVQADKGSFIVVESTTITSKHGLQVIGTPAMNPQEVISMLMKIANL